MSGKSIKPKGNLQEETESKPTKKNTKSKSVEERFQKKSQREHVLIRPDMYIGSITPENVEMWVYDNDTNLIIKKMITYVPGFYKIIDELIVNARDHQVRDPTCTWIKMYFNQKDGSVTIWNNGSGIPIEFHKDENMYVPELIFGHLLAGENFNDDEEKIVGGRNGLGSKCIGNDTIVPLFNGTLKLAKDLTLDDKLIGDDGTVRNIKNIINGFGKMYEVSQVFGESYKVNENHILTLYVPDHKVIRWNDTIDAWIVNWWNSKEMCINSKKIKITKKSFECENTNIDVHISKKARKSSNSISPYAREAQLARKKLEKFCKSIPDNNTFDISIKDYLNLSETTKSFIAGIRGDCVKWEHTDVTSDPYLLGLSLGNDTSKEYATMLHNDIEKVNHFPLEKYNFINDKHIPSEYIANDEKTRLEVLAGFIDSAKIISIDSDKIVICKELYEEQLINDITFLARSLGFHCLLTMKNTIDMNYNFNISGNIEQIPLRLYKCNNFGKKTNDKSKTNMTNGQIKIEEIPNEEYIGIEIDKNQRFVINDFTVTHNCSNIYSHSFILETVDTKAKKKYVQEWKNNMSEKSEPLITDIKKGEESYTKITCYPDYARFGMTKLDDDHLSLLMKRAYDISACTGENVKVYLNDELIQVKKFTDYIKLHYKEDPTLIYETYGDRWKIGVVYEPDMGNQQVSFVNGVWTYQGGTHVKYIEDQIYEKLIATIKKKHKVTVKKAQIREHFTFFVDAIINNPAFTSQTKGELNTKVANFGSTCTILDGFIKKIEKTGIVDIVGQYATFKEENKLKQTDGSRRGTVRDIPKLDDAEWAGTQKGKYCKLILTEGDSAKAFALAGLKKIGRQQFGVFPLKGKPLNFRKATYSQIKKNKEFEYLKRILGLKMDKVYTDLKDLRYGGIIILTDQDVDGSHIKGLIINMLQCYWPELLKIDGFIQTLSTPLIKAFKKSDSKKKNGLSFYTITDYEKWVKEVLNGDTSKYLIKYYKGLGTSDDKEAREIFSDFEKRIVSFIWETAQDDNVEIVENMLNNEDAEHDVEGGETIVENDSETKTGKSKEKGNGKQLTKAERAENKKEKMKRINRSLADPEIFKSPSFNSITLMFEDGRENDRKAILKTYDRNLILEYDDQFVTYSDFIRKDMIHFSHEDNIRSIPALVDGMKPSQRKILYAAFKKNQTSEIKVAQLAAYVSEHTAYLHGEVSLQEAIVGMAQIFPGSNNICLLHPSGNHGHRNMGGKDHASPRYIFTNIEQLTFTIFRKEDDVILNHLVEEGDTVEPEFYYPITPMVLINGSTGVGTGYSSNILQYNPKDINNNLFRRMDGKPMNEMLPWYNGFNGTIAKIKENEYIVLGKYELVPDNNNAIRITEIPIKRKQYCWIEDYHNFLKSLISEDKKDDKIIADVKRNGGNDDVDFLIEFKPNEFQKLYKKGDEAIIKFFKLSTTMTSSNLHMYNSENDIIKYSDPLEVMEEFFETRLKMYELRKSIHQKVLLNELNILKYKVKFIEDYRSKKIIIQDKSEEVIESNLQSLEYPKLSSKYDAPEEDKTYSYLTNMRIWSLTVERINELNKEHKLKSAEYDDYVATTAINLWRRELQEFDKAYDKWVKDVREYLYDEEDEENGNKKPRKKTQSTETEKKPKKKVTVKQN